jgi:hypothetical protein
MLPMPGWPGKRFLRGLRDRRKKKCYSLKKGTKKLLSVWRRAG